MANLKQCDGCGKCSPNEKGEYIANRWLTVNVSQMQRFHIIWSHYSQEFLLCEDCMGLGEHHGAVMRWLDKLHTAIKRYFPSREEPESVDA